MANKYKNGQIVTIDDLLLQFTYAGWTLLAYLGKEPNVTLPENIEDIKLFRIEEYAFSPLNSYIDENQKAFLRHKLTSISFNEDAMESFQYFPLQWHPLVFARCEALKTTVPIESLDTLEMRRYSSLLYPDCPKICPVETRTGEDGILKQLSDAEHSVTHIVVGSAYHTVGMGVAMDQPSDTVYLAEGVEVIEAAAFANMTNLKAVHLPQSLRKIAPNAFAGCTSLSEASKAAIAPYLCENPLKATIAMHYVTKENVEYTYDETFTLTVTDTDVSKELILFELTKDTATVYLTKPQKTVTLSLGEEITETYREWSNGSIIEDGRYYEYDQTHDYTLKLISIQ